MTAWNYRSSDLLLLYLSLFISFAPLFIKTLQTQGGRITMVTAGESYREVRVGIMVQALQHTLTRSLTFLATSSMPRPPGSSVRMRIEYRSIRMRVG